MEPFPHKLPPAVEQDGAHHGIGAGAAPGKGGERQGSVHPGMPSIGVIQSLAKAELPFIMKKKPIENHTTWESVSLKPCDVRDELRLSAWMDLLLDDEIVGTIGT
jgi:hypothetical protein